MFAMHSTEAQIDRFLREEDMKSGVLAALAQRFKISGASDAMLSRMRTGQALDRGTAAELNNLITKLKRLRDAAKPLPVRFRDPDQIKFLLDLMDSGLLAISIRLITNEFFGVTDTVGDFFFEQTPTGPVWANAMRARLMPQLVAEQLVYVLKEQNVIAKVTRIAIPTKEQRQSAATSFEEVWPNESVELEKE